MSGRLTLLFVSALFTAGAAVAQEAAGAQWLQNFNDAKQKAKADGKDLLVDFTGSDWCIWCKRLDKEVFAESAFQTEIAKGYILVKLDYPQDESLVTAEVKAQNEQLQKDYGIEGYPTIFLMDADGRPYAQTGYQAGGPAKYLEHLAKLQPAKAARDAAFTKAKDATGLDRAKLLAAGLDGMDEGVVLKHYKSEVDEILKLDEKNEAGLQEKYAAKLALVELDKKFNEMAQQGDWDAVDKAMAEYLTKFAGKKDIEQKATFYRAVVLLESKQDFDGALKMIQAAIDFAKDSEFAPRLEQIKKNVEEIKKQQGGEEKKDEGKGGEEKKDGK